MTTPMHRNHRSIAVGVWTAIYWDVAMGSFNAVLRSNRLFPSLATLGASLAFWSLIAVAHGLFAYRVRARQRGEAIPLTRIYAIAVVPFLISLAILRISGSYRTHGWLLPFLGVGITAWIVITFTRDARQHDVVSKEREAAGGEA